MTSIRPLKKSNSQSRGCLANRCRCLSGDDVVDIKPDPETATFVPIARVLASQSSLAQTVQSHLGRLTACQSNSFSHGGTRRIAARSGLDRPSPPRRSACWRRRREMAMTPILRQTDHACADHRQSLRTIPDVADLTGGDPRSEGSGRLEQGWLRSRGRPGRGGNDRPSPAIRHQIIVFCDKLASRAAPPPKPARSKQILSARSLQTRLPPP